MRSREGFTLIEMLVVMAVIAMMCAALGVGAWKMYERVAISAVRGEMQSVLAAMEEYYEDYGQYPITDVPYDGMTHALVEALNGHYDCAISVRGMYWTDPWQQRIVYRLRNQKPLFKCSGPDQEADTNDDLVER